MMNDTMVTVQGWLGTDPQLRQAGGVNVANFRLGCTPRRFSRVRQEWEDGPTQWYGVSAWRALGEHCKRSLRVGEPVIVHGRLHQRSYVKDGVEVTVLEIEALVVGHDLTRGISVFNKTVGAARPEHRPESRPQQPAADAGPTVQDPWAVPGAAADAPQEVVAGAA